MPILKNVAHSYRCQSALGHTRFRALCLWLVLCSVGVVHSSWFVSTGVGLPQGLSVDGRWRRLPWETGLQVEWGLGSMGIYSEMPIRLGAFLPVSPRIAFDYGAELGGVAVWPGISTSSGNTEFDVLGRTEFGWAWGCWLGGRYRSLGVRFGRKRVHYQVPIAGERYEQIYDHSWIAFYKEWGGS